MAEETGVADASAVRQALGQEDGAAAKDPVVVTQEVLEALLSKRNLVKDQFLASNMNPQMYIPVHVLLAHDKLAAVGATEEAIMEAGKRSGRLGVDEAGKSVRPLLKSKRNVVIIRDVPEGTTEEEMKEFLAKSPHPQKIKEIKPDVNCTWFIKLDLDSCEDVVMWIRSTEMKGQKLTAAIKSEHFLRSFFPLHLPAGMMMPPMGMMPPWDPSMMPPGGDYGGYPGGAYPMPSEMGMADMPPGVGGKGMPDGMDQWNSMPQKAGFWQPWGKRSQPPPLVFKNATEMAK
jgi:hypothetical protein